MSRGTNGFSLDLVEFNFSLDLVGLFVGRQRTFPWMGHMAGGLCHFSLDGHVAGRLCHQSEGKA